MKVSEYWLREWVDLKISSTELVAQMTMAGLEVVGVTTAAPPFEQVVVGRLVELTPHPNADRLSIVIVDIGTSDFLRIVCGAPNAAVGMHVPTALIGAVLPCGLKIKPSKIRGIQSQGMLCSAQELGLEGSEGLLALPVNSYPGQSVRQLLELDDSLIEIELAPNRGDCLCMEGIAREIAALNRCEFHQQSVDMIAPVSDAVFPISLLNPADCPRYIGRVIRGVDSTAETPLWMRERLRRADIRALGPLVDVTNYVMLELGQPMHAFDLSRLIGGIEVRRAQPGDRLKLLNGVIVEPDTETLLIADRNGPLAIAGIMGGEISSCTGTTRDVFLESALFLPTSIAGRARRYGLQTDSSYRFERGIDTGSLQRRAIERATQLLTAITGGNPGPIIEEVFQDYLPMQQTIILRPERIEKLLGMKVSVSEVEETLCRLNMIVSFECNHWCVIPPSSRSDITIEADIIEEIVRVHGYEHIPSNRPLALLSMTPQPEGLISLEQFKSILVQRGFQEAITYSFVDPVFQKYLDPESKPLALANPISIDLAVMRTNLWPGLLKAVIYNQNRQQTRLRLFECGSNFILADDLLQQDIYLGGVAAGCLLPEQWGIRNKLVDFYDLKSDIEALLSLTGELQSFEFCAAQHPALNPGQSARIRRKVVSDIQQSVPIGWIGALHSYIARKLGIKGDVFVFELLLKGIQRMGIPGFMDLHKFPFSRRDISFSVDETVTAQSVYDCIRQHGGELLREVRFFDIYRGTGVPNGRKSLALGLILQDFSCNLTDHMIEETISGIISGLIEDLDATLRI